METHSVAAETDTLLGVENGTLREKMLALSFARGYRNLRSYLPNEGLDATGTTVGLVEGNLTNNCAAVVPGTIECHGQLLFQFQIQSASHTCGAS